MPLRGVAGEIAEVRRSGGELHLEWRIPRFLDLDRGVLDHYESPRFGFLDARWFLRVWPDWQSYGEVHLSLRRDDGDDAGPSARTVTFSVGVRVSGGGVEWRREEEEREIEKGGGWYLGDTCKRSELREQQDRLVPGGALTVVCQMRVPGTAATGASSSPDVPIPTDTRTGEPNARACKCQSLDKQGPQSSDECDICCEAAVDSALNPCGHMCWCYNCALRFLEVDSPRCPMCRTSITNILKLYGK